MFCSNARGAHLRTLAVQPGRVRSFVPSSVRVQVGSLLCRSGRSKVRRCNSRVPCAPLSPPAVCDCPAPNSTAFRVVSCTVFFEPPAVMGGFTRWADSQKGGGDDHRAPRSGSCGGGSCGRSKGKYSRGRGTKGGAAAWLSAGVVASTYRGTGLVRSPVPLRLPPRPFGRAAVCGREARATSATCSSRSVQRRPTPGRSLAG